MILLSFIPGSLMGKCFRVLYANIFKSLYYSNRGAIIALTPPCIVNINCVRCSCSTEAHSHERQLFIGLGQSQRLVLCTKRALPNCV